MISAFKRSSPLITLELRGGNIIDLMNDLVRDEIQFVIGHQTVPALGPGITDEVLPSEPLVVVAGTAINKKNPTWAELLNYRWCLPPPGTPLRDHFDHVLTIHHLSTPPILVETSGTLLAEELILRGGFLAITCLSTGEDWKARGLARVLPIEVPPWPIQCASFGPNANRFRGRRRFFWRPCAVTSRTGLPDPRASRSWRNRSSARA